MARDASHWPYQPLHDACVARDWGLVVRLATSPRGPDLARAHDRNGWLPLHIAVERGAPIATIHALLDAHADAVRTRTEHGDLPLHVAAIYGAPVAVVHLLCWKYPVRRVGRKCRRRRGSAHTSTPSPPPDRSIDRSTRSSIPTRSCAGSPARARRPTPRRRRENETTDVDARSPYALCSPYPPPCRRAVIFMRRCVAARHARPLFGVVVRSCCRVVSRVAAQDGAVATSRVLGDDSLCRDARLRVADAATPLAYARERDAPRAVLARLSRPAAYWRAIALA